MRSARRAAISLPSAEGRHQHGGRGDGLDGGLQRVDLGDDQVVGVLGGVVGQDLDGAVLAQDGGGVGGTGTQRDGDRLADTAGQGQQLQGGLADGAVHVVDIDENFSHGNALLRIAKSEGAVRGLSLSGPVTLR
ncbi:hypothetical protein M2157_008373 [Streptomyces sp. SAI-127]|nr:hypothetical protein [Streptomyces sp. SAI-127]